MSFTTELRQGADSIYNAIFEHPFVRGIANGTLSSEQLIHYVKQDFEYLNVYMRIYGIAISKCEEREQIQMFNEQIAFILNSEIHPHQNFCERAGVTYESLQGYSLAPSAHHYTRHMLNVAHEGSLEDILAALLPCPWTYQEIGQRLLEEVKPTPEHPFYEWIHFYANFASDVTEKMRLWLDEWAESLSEARKNKLREHFDNSCRLEYEFWDMAFTLEEWKV
ncbi:thiaminase II [Saccharibacillus sp. JS10]|uniref:thiaminase II n=1 Tax=Saccharibacillus sp. JS10 TaxID=2950552 RepID=UPI00210EBA09|nr:thiaminase II [Saccharibacillus sp. JS10]MCQ4086587.1 thiaminase II [Saccharibacillus sp. JS10]